MENTQNKKFNKTVYGVGYTGEGVHICRDKQGVLSQEYKVWANMIKRCYTKYAGDERNNGNYSKVEVHESWHNYQTFGDWYMANTTKYVGTDVFPKLDKDLLSTGARGVLYGPDTCAILPNILNCSLVENKVTNTVANGIRISKSGKYVVQIMSNYKNVYNERFLTAEEALAAYVVAKAGVISGLADQYEYLLDPKIYSILKTWKPRSY